MSKEKAVEGAVSRGAETIEIINSALKGLLTGAGKLEDFTVEQLPDVIVQFLQWRFYLHLVECVFPTILLIIVGYSVYRGYKHGISITSRPGRYDNTVFYHSEGYFVGFVVTTGICSFISLTVFFAKFNIKWLQILVAPKIYLLEYAASTIK